nr:glycosyltransferase [uncultured Acetatifactor sp.]
MKKLTRANFKKLYYYLKRNGIADALSAAKERLGGGTNEDYAFIPPDRNVLDGQRREAEEYSASFSIIVPAYRTKSAYLQEMLESVLRQSYSKWELILADSTEDDSVEKTAGSFTDERVRYVRLPENLGISENTNRALELARFPFIGLLDHDDLLAPDALFQMAKRIEEGKKAGINIRMLYSDEDKCSQNANRYYEPNFKESFNLDLLLSNNYICHFLVMDGSLMKRLGFRKEYDGAQDYDLVLRAAGKLMQDEKQIAHIPRVLYHWRCHGESTAQNPQSKQYAYEAGLRAVKDFTDRQGWKARIMHLKHLGFYGIAYEGSVFAQRRDIGAVGGKVLKRGRIDGGRYAEDGEVFYKGLPGTYSGYLHRASLTQDAFAVDLRLIMVREECRKLFEQTVGVPYVTLPGEDTFDASVLPADMDIRRAGLAFGSAMKNAGYRILWQPSWRKKV